MSHSIRQHLLPLSILLLATLIFFWPVLLGGVWHIPQGGGDIVSFLWPTYRYAAHSLREGDVPLWNPYLYSGAPYAADNQSGLFYPPNLALMLLPDVPYRAMEWLVLFHVLLGGVGMYVLIVAGPSSKTSRAGPTQSLNWAGVVAALAFQFSSVFVTHIGNLNIVATSAYLPWAMFCLHRMTLENRTQWATALAACLALAVLAGHAQMALIVGLAVAIGSLCKLISTLRTDRQKALRLGFLLALTLGLVFGLTAIATLPATEMMQYTKRAALSYEEASRYSLPPSGLAGMLSPILFGRGVRDFWPLWDRVELGYLGAVTLFLAGLATSDTRTRRFAYLLAGVGLAVSLGKYTPVHLWMYKYVPGFGHLRIPARFILLTNFALAYLAGVGLQDWKLGQVTKFRLLGCGASLMLLTILLMPIAWSKAAAEIPNPPSYSLALAVVVILSTIGATLIIGRYRWRAPGIAILLAIELIGLGSWVEVDVFDPNEGYGAGPAVNYLRDQTGTYRIDVAATSWQPDAPTVHRLETVSGLHNPLALANYDTYYWAVGYRGSSLYNFLNVRFLITDKDTPAADSTFVPVFDEDPDVDVYLNTNSQPRISLIYKPILVSDSAAAFDAIHAKDFDPRQEVVLENGNALPPRTDGESKLYYTRRTSLEQTIVAITPSPAYLVLSEVWYPGWITLVNGHQVEIIRANYAFRAVYLPAGDHKIEMYFQPKSWLVGLATTLATIVVTVVYISWNLMTNKSLFEIRK